MVECPARTKELFQKLAAAWDERFIDAEGEDGPAVMVDGYEAVGWDVERGAIVYSPSMDPKIADPDAHHPAEHFIITEGDLQKMVDQPGFCPQDLVGWV